MATLKTTNLINATTTADTSASYTAGQTITLDVVANDGYYFESTPYLKITKNKAGSISSLTVNLETTSSEYPQVYTLTDYTLPTYTAGLSLYGTGVEMPASEKTNFTLTVENATCNVDGTTQYNVGDSVEITVTADNDFYFATVPTINGVEMTTTQTEEQKTVYTATHTMVSGTNEIIATAVSIPVPIETGVIVSKLTYANTNITETTEFEIGSTVRVEVTANEGYFFQTAPYLKYSGITSAGVPYTHIYTMLTDETGDYKTTYYYDYVVEGKKTYLYGDGQVIPDTDKYGIITMYNPTPEELKEIGNVRYNGEIDLGNYISSLLKVYVKIPKNKKAQVLLGGYKTEVESYVITNEVIETSCGSVSIDEKFHNSMDYENTTIEIYLPFIGFVKLDTEKVMNETISLLYRTNVLNGDTIACIYNTTGTLLYTFNCNASFEIPYRLGFEEPNNQIHIDSGYLFGFTPFVTIRNNKPYNTTNVIGADNRQTSVGSLTGYIKCSEVFNTIKAPTQEKEEITTLLKEGVILWWIHHNSLTLSATQ